MSDEICPPEWKTGILCDKQIRYLAESLNPIIVPFIPHQVKENNVISYGLSSYGYDVRISDEFKIIDFVNNSPDSFFNLPGNPLSPDENMPTELSIIDPTDLQPQIFKDFKGPEIIIPPHGFALGRTIEVVNIPRDVLVIALGKSTWNRCGLVVGVTPLEPGFQGTVTLELSNTTDLPIRVKAGHGIHQFLFLKGSETCETSYADRAGKYQGQFGVTLPRTVE